MSAPSHTDEKIYDLLVIGGGINGTGIARDAAGRGLKVALCEKDDLAQHTSSASTKLIHGGLRYLEHYDFKLVRHALKEREILLNSAPHIIWPVRFILPHHPALRPRWLIRLGLFLYDHIGGRKTLPKSYGVNLATHPSGSALKPEFKHAFEYSDCAVQDARLVVLNARDAANHGADVFTHTRCTELQRGEKYWQASLQGTSNSTIKARAVVNASGPWVDKTLRLFQDTNQIQPIRKVKGSHIIVKKLFDHPYPYIFQNADGRILFAIPYEQDFTLIGTTDVDYEGDLNQVQINDDEIHYICESISEYFTVAVTPKDVIWHFSGVRPLFDDTDDVHGGNASKVSRDYVLKLDNAGSMPVMLSVYGGKITTYRKLSEQAVDLLSSSLNIRKPAWTEQASLPGGNLGEVSFETFLIQVKAQYAGLDDNLLADYARLYGTELHAILNERHTREDLGHYFGGGLFECEVNFLIKQEWAVSAEDIVWRRTKKGLKMTKNEVLALQEWLNINKP
ncbi:MAG: glycerol-3-phosphate dehydrogenase [Arenicellales bacterium]